MISPADRRLVDPDPETVTVTSRLEIVGPGMRIVEAVTGRTSSMYSLTWAIRDLIV